MYRGDMNRAAPGSEGFAAVSGNAKDILARLLSVAFPGRDEVARQVAVARIRALDADGSLDLLVTDVARANVIRRIPVEAEAEDVDGMTFHVLLHVVDGYIDELEVYRNDSEPLQGPIRPEALRILVL
jgi:hypothetical protein